MYRPTERILVDDHIRTMQREADARRLVAQAREAAKAPKEVRHQRAGLSFGFLRRLVDRLVAA